MSDFSPQLNRVKIESPTEDGKIAFVMNTMVPRRLDQFDDIRADLAGRNFNTDKAFLYVNFQAGDFCGRSYKLPLSELNEFVTDSILFGTNGKDSIIKFDDNFYIDEDHNVHLIVDIDAIKDPKVRERVRQLTDETSGIYDQYLLINELNALKKRDIELQKDIDSEGIIREAEDAKLELKKNDKFVVVGSGDNLVNGLPVPKEDSEDGAYGVHVSYINSEGPVIDIDGNRGVKILIDHDYRFASTITSKFDIGGIGKGQTILKGTPLETFIWQLLRGDPVIENIIYWKPSDVLPVKTPGSDISPTTWTDLGPWGHNKTTTNDDLLTDVDPITGWRGRLDLDPLVLNDQYVLIAVPRSNSFGFKPDDQGHWVVPLLNSNKAPNGIMLDKIYLQESPQFPYQFDVLKAYNEGGSTDWGYLIYFIDMKAYYPTGEAHWVAEFIPRP